KISPDLRAGREHAIDLKRRRRRRPDDRWRAAAGERGQHVATCLAPRSVQFDPSASAWVGEAFQEIAQRFRSETSGRHAMTVPRDLVPHCRCGCIIEAVSRRLVEIVRSVTPERAIPDDLEPLL